MELILKKYYFLLSNILIVSAGLIFGFLSCESSSSGNYTKSETEQSGIYDSSSIIDLGNKNFDKKISDDITLVEFWAEWCRSCKKQMTILEELSHQIGEKAQIIKVDVDNNQSLAVDYNVRTIPTLILFKNGKTVERFTGLQQKETLIKTIDKYIN